MIALDDLRLVRAEHGRLETRSGYLTSKCVPFAIIVQVTAGSYVVTGPEDAVRVAAGEVAVVAGDVPVAFAHRLGRDGRMASHWLHIQALCREVLDPCALYQTPCRITGPRAVAVGGLIAAFADLGPATGDDGPLPGRLDRAGLAWRALAEALAEAPAHPQAAQRLAAAARLGPFTAWLRANLHRPLVIDDLARAAGVSRSRLHTLCHEHLGVAPVAHLKELRLVAAARALLTTPTSVALVAADVGFANPYHFSREFARRYGMPPRRYRDEQRLSLGT